MRAAHQMITHSVQAWYGAQEFFAPNPDFDAGINYYLRAAASGQATIEIRDVYGNTVRTLTGPAAKGMNHATWNLRGDAPAAPAGQAAGAARWTRRRRRRSRWRGRAGRSSRRATYIVVVKSSRALAGTARRSVGGGRPDQVKSEVRSRKSEVRG